MNNEEKILAMLEQLQNGQAATNSRLDKMEQGQAATNARLDTLENGLSDRIREETAALRADMARLNHTIEPQMEIIIEGLEGLQLRYHQMDKLERKVEGHDDRIWALEQVVKAK